VTLRADVVKDGRRALLKARSVAARPLLDDGERGVTLQPVGGRALILVQLDSCYDRHTFAISRRIAPDTIILSR